MGFTEWSHQDVNQGPHQEPQTSGLVIRMAIFETIVNHDINQFSVCRNWFKTKKGQEDLS